VLAGIGREFSRQEVGKRGVEMIFIGRSLLFGGRPWWCGDGPNPGRGGARGKYSARNQGWRCYSVLALTMAGVMFARFQRILTAVVKRGCEGMEKESSTGHATCISRGRCKMAQGPRSKWKPQKTSRDEASVFGLLVTGLAGGCSRSFRVGFNAGGARGDEKTRVQKPWRRVCGMVFVFSRGRRLRLSKRRDGIRLG